MDYETLFLEEQVAQLFMVGYSGPTPNAITLDFLERGVGGIIFFRDNFDPLQPAHPNSVRKLLHQLSEVLPEHLPRLFFAIDQEGGQVERLPHTLFPTALSPMAVALSQKPEALAQQMYGMMAEQLVSLGFNLNFFPTLDVNLNPHNPIIGVRSFGEKPDTVWRLSHIAMNAFEQAGLMPVGKHFPGHGNGTVDSHLDLPTLNFTEEELKPFQQAIQAGLPAMLVAHGFYPALQTTDVEKGLPSSASPTIIQGLLRKQCGFDGLIITDDMCMGAITQHRSPVEAAMAALKAGVDILLYKQSTAAEWEVYEAVVEAFRNGDLPLAQLHASLERIFRLKARYTQAAKAEKQLPAEYYPRIAEEIAWNGISILQGNANLLPVKPGKRLLLIHPDRQSMGNYAFDMPTSRPLDDLLRQAGLPLLDSITYPATWPFSSAEILNQITEIPDLICMVSFNPLINTSQAELYTQLRERFPNIPFMIASAGTPYDTEVMLEPHLHLALCSYRPATLKALALLIAAGPTNPAKPLPAAAAKPL